MAMAWIWTGMVILSVIFGFRNGTMDAVGNAAMEGAAAAVELCLSMAGIMCLWSGIMSLMKAGGLTDILSKAFRPVLSRLLPRAARDEDTLAALTGNLSCNLLGLGNAATPLGIQAARRMADLARQGHKVVAVVSAQGHTTDRMIAKAAELNRRGSAREMDAYLAAGEQMSAGLMTMAIGALGHPAVSLTGWQAGIHTDGVHGNARILSVDTERIQKELDRGRIVVVAGFQGIDPEGAKRSAPVFPEFPAGAWEERA